MAELAKLLRKGPEPVRVQRFDDDDVPDGGRAYRVEALCQGAGAWPGLAVGDELAVPDGVEIVTRVRGGHPHGSATVETRSKPKPKRGGKL